MAMDTFIRKINPCKQQFEVLPMSVYKLSNYLKRLFKLR